MAAIADSNLRHVRKTIAFDGSANNGNLGDEVPVFTTTGRVQIEGLAIFCSDSLVCAAGGDTSLKPFLSGVSWASAEFFIAAATTGTWADDNTTGFKDAYGIAMPGRVPVATDGNVTLSVFDAGAGADITDGTVIIDCWYRPITDDGALAGDDIDSGYTPVDVKAWLGTAAATPTVAGVPEVDVTHFGGTAGTFAAGIPEAKVASIAAAAITAAAVATGAFDADALATDAVTEIVTAVLTTQMTEAYNADGTAPTLAQAIFLLIAALTEFSVTGTTVTAKKLDGSTTAATWTLNSATQPTSRTRAS